MAEKEFAPIVSILPPMPCAWTVGVPLEKFYQDLSEKKLSANKCTACKKVFAPPKKYCPDCGAELSKWVELKGTGVLVNYTVAHQNVNGSRREQPLVIGLVKLDGADTAVFGQVRVAPPHTLACGLKVKAVFADQPGQTVESLSHFEPAGKK